MKKLILKFASGRDANKEYSFDAVPALSVTIGRDPACQVVVHEQEDAVSRRHALIQPADPAKVDDWIVVDNGSANGLFINDMEVKQRHPINDEDVIRLGRNGPTLLVAFDPKPLKATRVVSAASVAKATRLETPAQPASLAATREQPAINSHATAAPAGGVGKETLERRIGEVTAQVEKKSNKKLVSLGAVAVGLLVAVGGFSYYRSQLQAQELVAVKGEAEAAMNKPAAFDAGMATHIRNEWGDSTVQIEAKWQMVEAVSGSPVYHRFYRLGGKEYMEYEELKDGSIRPLITYDPKQGLAVGGTHSGTGFVVSADGFIMTNRHVAEGWTAPFPLRTPGKIYRYRGRVDYVDALPTDLDGWSPMRDDYFREKKGVKNDKRFEGRNISIEVLFQKGNVSVPARNGSSSKGQDVALLRIDAATPLTPVVLNREADATLQPGNKVVQLGFPSGSPSTTYLYQSNSSQAGEAAGYSRSVVPDVSVNEGIVSKKGQRVNNASIDAFLVPSGGDYIEMNINHSGSGNSGGPIFDTQGKVVALFTADASNGTGRIALGVPIHYGLQLLDPTHKVIK